MTAIRGIRLRRAVRCPTCASSWTDRKARFCGRCGAPLDPVAVTGPTMTSAPGPRRRWLGVALVAVTVAALGGVGTLTGVFLPAAIDPEVALPDADAVPTEPPLSGEEADALRQQVSRQRVRCEPRGCELWRRQRADIQGLATVGGLVVILEDGHVVALDGETGEESWREPVDDLLPFGAGAQPPGGRQQLVGIGDAVLVLGRSHLALLDSVGARRWTTPAATYQVIDVRLDGDVAVLAGEFGPEGQRMLVVDLAGGDVLFDDAAVEMMDADLEHAVVMTRMGRMEVRDLGAEARVLWERQIWQERDDNDSSVPIYDQFADIHHAGGGRLVLTARGDEHRLEVLDIATGAALWQRPLPPDTWPVADERWVAVPEGSGGSLLLDVATGEQVATFDGEIVHRTVAAGGHYLTVMIAPRQSGGGFERGTAELVALDGDAEVVWSIPLGDAELWQCCAWVRPGDGRTLTVSGETSHVHIDVATGEILDTWTDTRNGTGYFLQRWYSPDGSRVQIASDGVTIESHDGSVTVLPTDVWPETEAPWVLGNATELLGIRLMPAR